MIKGQKIIKILLRIYLPELLASSAPITGGLSNGIQTFASL